MNWLIRVLLITFGLLPGGVSAADGPQVMLFDADGRTTRGELGEWSADSIRLQSPEPRQWRWRDVVSVRFEDRPAAKPARGAVVWLANGDRLFARAAGIVEEELKVVWPLLSRQPETFLPLEAIRGLSLALPQSRHASDQVAAWNNDRREPHDEIRLANGDRVAGELIRWDEGALRLKAAAAQLTLRQDEVREIAFNSDLVTMEEPKAMRWLLELTDGSRVTVLPDRAEMKSDGLTVSHLTGATWQLPTESICSLTVLGGRAVFLSDLTPIEFEHLPFLPGSRTWPLRRDRSVDGSPLRLMGREFAKGIGLHSRSVATYSLGPNDRFFSARVGFNETTSGRGTALVAVELDGRRVFAIERLSRESEPKQLPLVDVSRGKRLTLIVDFAELGDTQDRVDWCDAVVLRVK